MRDFEQARQHQELLTFGYCHEVEKQSQIDIATELILIIIEYLNCIFDINFDLKCPIKSRFSTLTQKKVQSLGTLGGNLLCNIEQVFTNKMCDSFKIIFKATWTNPVTDYGSFFMIGYVTESLNKSIPDWRKGLGYKLHQYAFQLFNDKQCQPNCVNSHIDTQSVIQPKDHWKYEECKYCIHKSGDILAIRYSFKTHTCELYHNGQKMKIWFDHSSELNTPTQVIPLLIFIVLI